MTVPRLIRVICLALVAMLAYSCLEPLGENWVSIQEPKTEEMSIELNLLNPEPILFDGNTSISFTVNGYPLYVMSLDVTFDEQYVYSGTASSFTLYPTSFQSGQYTMHVTVTGRTRNGSLADRLDLEMITLERDYAVKIDSEPPAALAIIKLDTSVGTMTLHWEKCNKLNFISYQVFKSTPSAGGATVVEITDPDITSWTDVNYVGGAASYWIYVQTKLHMVIGPGKEYSWDPNIEAKVENGFATLRWRRPFFYNNILQSTIKVMPTIPVEISFTDTVYSMPDKLLFGDEYSFQLKHDATNSNYSAAFGKGYYVGTKYEYPNPFPSAYNASEDLYYGESLYGYAVMDNTLTVLNYDDLSVQRSLSSNGQYFVSIIGNDFYLTNPRTFARTLAFETDDEFINNVTLADNGLVGYFISGGTYKVVSLTTGEIKFTDPPHLSSNARLSPSGNYLIGKDNKVYRYDGSSFVEEGVLPTEFNSISGMVFTHNDNLLYVIHSGGTTAGLFIKDIQTYQAIVNHTISPLGGYLTDSRIDRTTNNMLLKIGTYWYLLHPDGTLNKLTFNQVGSVHLLNNSIFSNAQYVGYYIDCNYLE